MDNKRLVAHYRQELAKVNRELADNVAGDRGLQIWLAGCKFHIANRIAELVSY